MKTLKIKSLLALLAVIGLGLVSCETLNGPEDYDPGEEELGSIFTSAIELNQLDVEGGIDDEFEIEEIYSFEEGGEGDLREYGKKGRKGYERGCKGVELNGIMRDLDLTDEQKEETKVIIENTKECSSEYFEALRDATRAIVEPYNEQRQAIKESVKSGDLTREDAITQLDALKEQIRAELDASNEVAALKESISTCRETFKSDFALILTEDQLVIWNEWLAEKEAELI